MRLRRNLLAGLASSVWAAIIGLAVVPFYLKYLGIEAYGLIGFLVTTQSLLQILDLGLSPTINREVARYTVANNLRAAAKLLRTLSVIYWAMALVIAVILVLAAPLIARYWLQAEHIPQETVRQAVMLIGLIIALRWPTGLYQGALIGAQRMVVSSAINSAVITVGGVGGVVVLAFISPTIQALFIWQACVAVVHTQVLRGAAWRIIGYKGDARFDVSYFAGIWRFSAGMSAITLSALVFTQLDKVLLSKLISLPEFGHYMLATAIASGLYVLITPFFNVVYPKLSAVVVTNDIAKLTDTYRLATCLLATVLFPIAAVLVVFAEDVVRVWTGDAQVARSVAPLIALLSMGSALHGLMHLPFALQLAYGSTRLPLMINTMLLVVLLPIIVILSMLYGAVGGALAWLILHVLYLILGTWLTHRHFLKGIGFKWLFQDMGVPLVLSVLVVTFGSYLADKMEFGIFGRLISASSVLIFAVLISVVASQQLRRIVITSLTALKVSGCPWNRVSNRTT